MPAFQSSILPKRKRLSMETQKLFCQLYLDGPSSGDFEPVFRQLLGETAPLSPNTILRLKEEWEQEYEACRFALNEVGRQLQGAARFLDLDGIGGRMARAWSTLPEYVRTGRPAYAAQFGRSFWEELAAHPDVAADFDALTGSAGTARPMPRSRFSADGTPSAASSTWVAAPGPCAPRSCGRDPGCGEGGRWIEVDQPARRPSLVIFPREMMPDWADRRPLVVFRCADAEPAHRTLSARGVTFARPPERMA